MKINLDKLSERAVRGVASRTSRRGLLARLGTLLVAAPAFPLLPVARGAGLNGKAPGPQAGTSPAAQDGERQAAHSSAAPPGPETDFGKAAQASDPTQCNYWRYCGTDGFLCSCCGGGVHTCPPGTQVSPTSWIGSCLNPADQRTYLVAYRDCCGVGACGECYCNNTEGETPVYRASGNNNIIWCFGTSSMEYHCSIAVVVGLDER